MNREDINNLLHICLTAPDGQLCKSMHEQINLAINSTDDELSDIIKNILDLCAKFSLASEFTMILLDQIWTDSINLIK
jgi:hypothetical protein